MYIQLSILLTLLFAGAPHAMAHVPNLVTQTSLENIVTIDDPTLSQSFYGEMTGFPHTYEIRATEPFTLFTSILIPDIETGKNNVSGIVIREGEGSGRVEEVARLPAKDAQWNSKYEPFGGDSYREGPVFEEELEAGTYRIEVSTPDNLEKYVLVVGKREVMTIGYVELIRRLAGIKLFFGKSQFRVVESPYVYVPLLGVTLVGILIWYVRRPKTNDPSGIL